MHVHQPHLHHLCVLGDRFPAIQQIGIPGQDTPQSQVMAAAVAGRQDTGAEWDASKGDQLQRLLFGAEQAEAAGLAQQAEVTHDISQDARMSACVMPMHPAVVLWLELQHNLWRAGLHVHMQRSQNRTDRPVVHVVC